MAERNLLGTATETQGSGTYGPLEVLEVALVPGTASIDIFGASGAPFRLRILDVLARITGAGGGGHTLQLFTATGGGGTSLSGVISTAAAGRVREGAGAVTTTDVDKGGHVWTNALDATVTGSVTILYRRLLP